MEWWEVLQLVGLLLIAMGFINIVIWVLGWIMLRFPGDFPDL